MTGDRPTDSDWSTTRVRDILSEFVSAGLLGPFEVQLAAAAARAEPSASDPALLALALVARATRLGHVCVRLDEVRRQVAASLEEDGSAQGPEVPVPDEWARDLERSGLVASPDTALDAPLRPMVWDRDRLYLQRYWVAERSVAAVVAERTGSARPVGVADDVEAVLDRVFPPDPEGAPDAPDLQRVAARRALEHPVTVIAGGPGTGKTHTVAAILAAAHQLAVGRGAPGRMALAAPTGKAAARMGEAVEERVGALRADGRIDEDAAAAILAVRPTTIHRLLGSTGRSGFRHGRSDPLPHDLVIIDETSMVSLPLLGRLLESLRPAARLVLVGDPFQLSSIEAGTVMADLVGPWGGSAADGSAPLHDRVTELVRGHRFSADSATAALALAIRRGDGDGVMDLLRSEDPLVHWASPDDPDALGRVRAEVVAVARAMVASAVAGDEQAALAQASQVKVLAAVRNGPNGLAQWTDRISAGVVDLVPAGQRGGWPRLGTPVMVTGNDPVNHLANGDVGVVVHDDGRWVVMGTAERTRRLAPARLGAWEPWWAMTVHKSQGSEFAHAVVALPTTESPILSRELLYTAVTRAKPEVTVVATESMVRLAVSRPAARASGLRNRLWPDDRDGDAALQDRLRRT